MTVEGSIPRFSCHAQNPITKGVKVKIMNGLKAWNQVTGISPCQTMRSMVRSVWSSAHSTIVLPCCSYVAQNNVVGRNNAISARMARHSLRSSGFLSSPRGLGLVHLVRRQHGHGVKVDDERDRHADAGGGEPIMPAQLLAERAANQRREERADIDADVEDRIGAVAPMVSRRVEAADLGRDIGLEGAIAEDERERAPAGTVARMPS